MLETSINFVNISKFLNEHESIESRLRETSEGDIEYFQSFPPAIPGLSCSEGELLSLLRDMEREGKLTRTEAVRPEDSAEYVVTWRLRQK